jgi:copper resistance protein D
LDDPLIYVRAVHYAATITVAGVVFFVVFIAEPAFRSIDGDTRLPAAVEPPLAWLAWIGLVLTLASGAVWFILVAASMGERPAAEVFSDGFLWVVLLQTDFGRAWLVRAILAGLLAVVFAVTLTTEHKPPRAIWLNIVAVATAAGLVGILAWGATPWAAPGPSPSSIRLPIFCTSPPQRRGSVRSLPWRWCSGRREAIPRRSRSRGPRRFASRRSAL